LLALRLLLISVLAVIVILVTAAAVGWREYQSRVQRAESVRYAAAVELAQKNELGRAADDFALLARESVASADADKLTLVLSLANVPGAS